MTTQPFNRFANQPYIFLPPGDPHLDIRDVLPEPDNSDVKDPYLLAAIRSYDCSSILHFLQKGTLPATVYATLPDVILFACTIRHRELLQRCEDIFVTCPNAWMALQSNTPKYQNPWLEGLEYGINTGDIELVGFVAPRCVQATRYGTNGTMSMDRLVRYAFEFIQSAIKQSYSPDRFHCRERCFQILVEQGLSMRFDSEGEATHELYVIPFQSFWERSSWWRLYWQKSVRINHYDYRNPVPGGPVLFQIERYIDKSFVPLYLEQEWNLFEIHLRARSTLMEILLPLPFDLIRYGVIPYL